MREHHMAPLSGCLNLKHSIVFLNHVCLVPYFSAIECDGEKCLREAEIKSEHDMRKW